MGKNKMIRGILIFVSLLLFAGCAGNGGKDEERTGTGHKGTGDRDIGTEREEKETAASELMDRAGSDEEVWEKGYDLPVTEKEKKEAAGDCEKSYEELKEEASFLSPGTYSSMENYGEMDRFLEACMEKQPGIGIVYEAAADGNLVRRKFIFDGKDMCVLNTVAVREQGTSGQADIRSLSTTLTRVRTWEYTKRGWFIYELCTPEPPEVTEVVDGTVMLRVKPFEEKYAQIAEDFLLPVSYRGNNLFCSEWDGEHMGNLDYTALFEYLYLLDCGEKFNPAGSRKYTDGIPAEEFESLMTKYLPVSKEQLREYAPYDPAKNTYLWQRLGCGNYAPRTFWSSFPEIISHRENEDGTVTLTIHAVCEPAGSEDVLTHELTVKLTEKGIQFLGNHIPDEGVGSDGEDERKGEIPEYQYRISRS